MAARNIHIVRAADPAPIGGGSSAGSSSAGGSSVGGAGHDALIERYQHGWRSGKPLEDPEKLKRWGFIGAKPSEYLVCTRRGEIDRRRSGQGVRIFKWPWETIAIVPTTLQRIEFVADQITREHVGVSISGVAVFRIAAPEIAFRVLNFTYGEAAAEKLATTLREMFVGAARRLVANLSLQECLTRRKETIATFLMEEIAPVVGGEGSPDDTTMRGWGVVIDTIEIQQVTIQSELVFNHLQAPFRAEIAARAELAELERARQVAERRAETERLSQEAHLESSRATRALKARTEAEAAEVESREAARRAEMVAGVARRNVELERDRALHQIEIAEEQRRARAAAELATLEADAVRIEALHKAGLLEQERGHALAMQRLAAEGEVRRAQATVEHELRHREAETRDRESQGEAAAQRRLAEIELSLAQSRTLRELVGTALPQLAAALQPHATTMHLTQIGGAGEGGGPLAAVPQAVGQILALAQSFGLELKR
jgi:regulator of protease activity HflC (stomatin/prohibitin superfamily)